MNDELLDKLIHDAEIEASMSHDDDQRECVCSLDEYVNGVLEALCELRAIHADVKRYGHIASWRELEGLDKGN